MSALIDDPVAGDNNREGTIGALTKSANKSNTGVPFHPLAAKFELLKGAEFDRLVDDIKTNGLREPIVKYEDQILDGRNRYRGCLAAKVDPEFRNFSGSHDEAAAFVESANFHRRHMTPSKKTSSRRSAAQGQSRAV